MVFPKSLIISALCVVFLVPSSAFAQRSQSADGEAVVSYEDQVYTYEKGEIKVRLWVPYPAGGETVRGVFQKGNAGRGDARCWTDDEQFRAYARQHGFGMSSTRGFWGSEVYDTYGFLLLEAYEMWADLGHHPELANVPFVCTGNSSSAAFAYGLANLVPERTICFAINVPAGLVPEEPAKSALEVPGIFIAGEEDNLAGNLSRHVEPLISRARPRGALWSKIEVEGMGHEHRRTLHLFYPFFEKCIALRYPADGDPRNGPVELLPVDEKAGWIAEDSTWGSGWTEVAPYEDFEGNLRGADTSWLLDEEMAVLHRAYSSRGSKVSLRSEDELPWPAFCNNTETIQRAPGEEILLAVELDGLEDWDTATLYDGTEAIETLTDEGSRFWYNVPIDENTEKRYRAFHVIVRRGGEAYPSHMYTPLILSSGESE